MENIYEEKHHSRHGEINISIALTKGHTWAFQGKGVAAANVKGFSLRQRQ